MTGEVADVLVVVEGEISYGIIQLSTGVDGGIVSVSPSEMKKKNESGKGRIVTNEIKSK